MDWVLDKWFNQENGWSRARVMSTHILFASSSHLWPKKGECGASVDQGVNKQSSGDGQIRYEWKDLSWHWSERHAYVRCVRQLSSGVCVYKSISSDDLSSPQCCLVVTARHYLHMTCLTLSSCLHIPWPMFFCLYKPANLLNAHGNPIWACGGTQSGSFHSSHEDNVSRRHAWHSLQTLDLPKFVIAHAESHE